jgi:uncharacterized protein (TIGR02246 family)
VRGRASGPLALFFRLVLRGVSGQGNLMFRRPSWLFVLAAVLWTGLAIQPAFGAPDSERVLLERRQEAFAAAMATRDATEVAACFADDAVLHIANQPPIQGKPAIQQFYSQVFRFLAASEFVPESLRIAASADLAYSTARVNNTFEREGNRIEYSGKSLLVWEKREETWKIAAYTVSNNRGDGGGR